MKTVIGTSVSDDAFSGIVVDAITSGNGKIRPYKRHLFVMNSTEDRWVSANDSDVQEGLSNLLSGISATA